MTRTKPAIDTDLCVVGAGILGLAHALEAVRRGLSVVVLERNERAVGASVRNFGHTFFGALAGGEPLQTGLHARERWLDLAPAAGLHLVPAGTLIVARHEDELAVLEATAADPARGQRMMTPREAGKLAPIPIRGMAGALHSTIDLRVDPRSAVAGLAEHLRGQPDVTVRFGEPVDAVEPGLVHGRTVQVRAPLVVVCPGPAYRALPSALQAGSEVLSRCRLQMLRVAAPKGRRYDPALATGLSLVRYPAFAQQPAAAPLRRRLERERPELLAHGIHLLVTQLPDGDLIVGDTHDYAETVSPFGDERLDELLLEEARVLLGAERLEVRQRWHGIYATAPDGNFLVTAPLDGVRVAQVVSGLGMTLAFGLAPQVLDDLLGVSERRRSPGPPLSAAARPGSGS
jgi:D-hydroxyproline dehydrogenase subunit beta